MSRLFQGLSLPVSVVFLLLATVSPAQFLFLFPGLDDPGGTLVSVQVPFEFTRDEVTVTLSWPQ